jgi:hypothetical protein
MREMKVPQGRHLPALFLPKEARNEKASKGKGFGHGSRNGFEEMVAIQLNVKFWPGQAKLKPADLGLIPRTFRKSSTWATRSLPPGNPPAVRAVVQQGPELPQ